MRRDNAAVRAALLSFGTFAAIAIELTATTAHAQGPGDAGAPPPATAPSGSSTGGTSVGAAFGAGAAAGAAASGGTPQGTPGGASAAGNPPNAAGAPGSAGMPGGPGSTATPPPNGAAGQGSPPRGTLMPAGSSSMGAGATGAASTQLPTVNPDADASALASQGRERPSSDGTIGASPREVYSEDWFGRTRPVLELHGYFRTRGELYHNFFLGRHNAPGSDAQNLWPQPIDNSYTDTAGTQHNVLLCGDNTQPSTNCADKSESSANLRFRVNPELHISDNLRIMSQVDFLDNVVLGSTPNSYAMQPGSGPNSNASGYRPAGNGYNGYAPYSAFSSTQGAPTSGVNSWRNSIDVKRVWAEYMTPVGQLRFGRMPQQWGLGMVQNAGDGIDSDYQDNVDRVMFVTGLKSLDLYFGGSWDFVSTGPTSASPYDVYGGQPYNTGNLTNVDQYSLFIVHRMNPDLQRLSLSRNEFVLNGGVYGTLRKQYLDVAEGQTAQTNDTTVNNSGLVRRGAIAFIPDLWVQAMWKSFRFEAEFASIYGSIDQTKENTDISNPVKVRQYGLTTQTELKAIEDKLRIDFGFGWASGDPWVSSLNPGSNGLQSELNGGRGPISTFHFNPAYTVDLIFYRRILSRVEGSYYFRPSVDYDFIRNPDGQKFGGGAAIVWSRASEFMQAPGHKRDLGVELDLQLYYQARDGSLNDDPTKVGGFYAALQYGVFFPLGGLDYLPTEASASAGSLDTSAAQTVRLFLGVVY